MKSKLFCQCLKKKKYNFNTATKVKERIFKERGIKLRIYYCDICNHYHLTSLVL